ncbi:MAG: SpoIIE family protein phosphatase [Coriobacteriia bacterium]|nr:SpoIIE family protein phosphatase [Coriobacteriia bacterium]
MGDSLLEKYQGRILDHVHEGIAIIDANGCYTFVNPTGEHILGKSKDDIIGRHHADAIFDLVNPDGSDTDPTETPVFLVIATGEPIHGAEYAVKQPDGSTSMILIDAEPFREETGKLMGALISFSDVTEVRRVQHLSDALNDINNAVIGGSDTGAVMQQALDMAVAALGCESGVIYLQDGADWILHYLSGLPDSMLGVRIPEASASFTVLTAGPVGSIAYNDACSDERIDNRLMRRHQIKSMLDVVLRVQDNLVGDVSFHYHSEAVPFSQDDIDFANKFGVSVGLALENAKLHQEKAYVIESLQAALLKTPKTLKGLEFAYDYQAGGELGEVGGDFLDLFPCEEGIGLVLGDVSGKGVDAAALAAEAKNALKALLYLGESPAAAAFKVNRMLLASTPPHIFITAFLATLETNSGKLTYCCAGHPPPLIHRADSQVRSLKTSSPLIAAFHDADYVDEEDLLAPGDRLLTYTDGVIEARRDGKFYGQDRLVQTVAESAPGSTLALVEDVLDDIRTFTDNQLDDDVAILAVALAQEDA